jgi:predicted sugar kinase
VDAIDQERRENGYSDPCGVVVTVQRNGVGAPSSAASWRNALVQYNARIRELERVVRRGLEQSYQTYALTAGAHAIQGGQPNNARSIDRREVFGVFSS